LPALTQDEIRAAAWAEVREPLELQLAPLGRHALTALAPRPGESVLDIGCGGGETALDLARAVAPDGTVVGIDLSAAVLAFAQRPGKGCERVRFVQADAQVFPFEPASFDAAFSRFGVMFFDDPCGALRELRRVLRPGARACFLSWGPFDQPYWQSMMGVVHRHVGGLLLQPDGPNPFRFGEPGGLSEVFRSAGFSEVEEETRTLPWMWPGPVEELWEYAQSVSVPFRPLLERVPAEKWPHIHSAVHEEVGRFFDGEKVVFGVSVVFASGRK